MTALKISNDDWDQLVHDICLEMNKLTGNVLSEKQHPMVLSRLKRRLIELKIQDPLEYKTYWKNNKEKEELILTGLLTTHFTSFFREFTHFEWIAENMNSIVSEVKKQGRTKISIWSAACSNGQEVWSLAMWFHFYLKEQNHQIDFEILGTDIAQESVDTADNGVYHRREIETAPRYLWENLWARGKGDIQDWYKVKNVLREKVRFGNMNLLKVDSSQSKKFDLILCRNVLIYFDKMNQQKVAKDLLGCLYPEGTLITGLSESLIGYGLPIKSLSTSVYTHASSLSGTGAPVLSLVKKTPAQDVMPMPLKILCVDDSNTVISILKKLLNDKEFEVIGVALNGLDAIEKLKTLRPDVITLDLHMPEMDGVTFLKQSGIAKEIPVVVVSSVSRDDQSIVTPLFNMGVKDFVEKPTLQNMSVIGEELKQKLKLSWKTKSKQALSPSVTKNLNSDQKNRKAVNIVVNCSSWDEYKLESLFKAFDTKEDHVYFYINEDKNISPQFKQKLEKLYQGKFIIIQKSSSLDFPPGKNIVWFNLPGANLDVLKKYLAKDHLVLSDDSWQKDSYVKSISYDF